MITQRPALPLVYQDEKYIVVNKPAGLSVHNGDENVITHLSRSLGERVNPVHRIDRETSGLLVLARGKQATAELQASLLTPESLKEYLLIVRGAPSTPHGTWTRELTPKAEGRRDPAGDPHERVEAQTRFQVIQQNQWLSLLKCQLITGRQHQIRRHAALEGCCVIGDTRYGDLRHAGMIEKRYGFSGIALHSSRLEFDHLGERRIFEVDPPSEWECFALWSRSSQKS